MNFSRRKLLLSVSGGVACSALAKINSASAQVGLSPGLWRSNKSPYAINYIGNYQTNVATFTSGAFNIGPAYADRMVLIGVTAFAATNTITVAGVSATNLVTSAANCSWWRAVDVPGTSVTVSGTAADAYRTIYVYTVTGVSGGKNANLDPMSAYGNNVNTVGLTYPTTAVGDVFLGVGAKPGTGGSNNFAGFGGTSGTATNIIARMGTLGNGFGGDGKSPPLATSGSKTVLVYGSDSSKANNLATLRISL